MRGMLHREGSQLQ